MADDAIIGAPVSALEWECAAARWAFVLEHVQVEWAPE
jgi:hypothetical protein